jgi:hypothetical protein
MDGILLVFDSLNLPKPTTPSRLKWRGRVVPAVAALVLATVFFLVYYVATRQPKPDPTYSPASVTIPSPSPAESTGGPKISEVPGSEKIETKPVEVQPATNKEVGESKSKPDTPSLPKDSKPKPNAKSAPRSQSSANAQEDDSKVGSILKKTGKLLKKPFKF